MSTVGLTPVHSWDRTVIQNRPEHYEENGDENGFNKTSFIYPTSRDSDMIEKLNLKHNGEFQYPDQEESASALTSLTLTQVYFITWDQVKEDLMTLYVIRG